MPSLKDLDADLLTPGRALDALIAETWMGWSRMTDANNGWETVHRPDGTSAEYHDRTLGPIIHLDMAGMPKFSTELVAAWTVVEKLESLGIMLWHVGREDAMPNWRAEFGRNHKPCLGVAEGKTAALAICRAAIKAHVKDILDA